MDKLLGIRLSGVLVYGAVLEGAKTSLRLVNPFWTAVTLWGRKTLGVRVVFRFVFSVCLVVLVVFPLIIACCSTRFDFLLVVLSQIYVP